MTNREKFEEIFGFKPYPNDVCVINDQTCLIGVENIETTCEQCPYNNWWEWEYKENNK